jgi:hypothetical protein
MLFYKGVSLEIDQTPDAAECWNEVSANATPNCVAQLLRLAKRLADVGSLRSPDQFNNEGDGFYAVKAECGLRAYGWYHSSRRGVFVISHFILKKTQKLSPSDKERMKRNRRQYELVC